ncbi:unnamed protein product [Prunus armeniaca]
MRGFAQLPSAVLNGGWSADPQSMRRRRRPLPRRRQTTLLLQAPHHHLAIRVTIIRRRRQTQLHPRPLHTKRMVNQTAVQSSEAVWLQFVAAGYWTHAIDLRCPAVVLQYYWKIEPVDAHYEDKCMLYMMKGKAFLFDTFMFAIVILYFKFISKLYLYV